MEIFFLKYTSEWSLCGEETFKMIVDYNEKALQSEVQPAVSQVNKFEHVSGRHVGPERNYAQTQFSVTEFRDRVPVHVHYPL